MCGIRKGMMKKKILTCMLAAVMAGALMACGSSSDTASSVPGFETIPADEQATTAATEASTEAATESAGDYNLPDGMYYSELTGEPISQDIQNQRPVGIMIDNDQRALPHFGISNADIMYELMNSTANNRITRLMCMFKDWGAIEKVGSIRSIRPTNILLGQEYDAVLCHDGGPFYINDYLSRYPYHFSGTFSRVDNGKAREFTEFCLSGDLDSNFSSSGFSREYDDRKQDGNQFTFAQYGGSEVQLDQQYSENVVDATDLKFPFYNTSSELKYNPDTRTYDYYEFGEACKDGGNDAQVTFKNVIVQDCTFNELDEHGYLIYNCIGGGQGYYCTNGKAIPIQWIKNSEGGYTKFYDADSNEITLNTGKTYITLIPDDTWGEVTLQ